jgi:hypothetical protein
MYNFSRQESEYSVAIHSLNPKGHMLFPSVLRSFYSAIGLGNQVYESESFFLSSKNFICSHDAVTDFWKVVIESGVICISI